MRKFILGLFVALWFTPASAGVPCTLPFNLQNGTTADATQVMANYNAITACLGNAAAAGANNDITALLALITPISPTAGGTASYYGGVGAGTATAQTISATVPLGFSLTAGYKIRYVVGTTNTAASTMTVGATTTKNILRATAAGLIALAGGELVASAEVELVYDGTQYQLLPGPTATPPPGTIVDYAGATAPLGWLLAQGQCVSQTAYAGLFTVLSTTWGACGGGLFALPDLRGRFTAAVDAGANRITNAGSGCTATLATGCGLENKVIAAANVPSLPVTITDPGHFHTFTINPTAAAGGGGGFIGAGTTSATTTDTTGITATANNLSLNTALPVLNPVLIVNKIIKY